MVREQSVVIFHFSDILHLSAHCSVNIDEFETDAHLVPRHTMHQRAVRIIEVTSLAQVLDSVQGVQKCGDCGCVACR
jgi:hypothetical protein